MNLRESFCIKLGGDLANGGLPFAPRVSLSESYVSGLSSPYDLCDPKRHKINRRYMTAIDWLMRQSSVNIVYHHRLGTGSTRCATP